MARSSLLSSLLVVSMIPCAVTAVDLLQAGAFYTFTNVNSLMFLVEPIQRMFNFNTRLKMTVLHNNGMLLNRVMKLIRL